jgi:hypothetical protein
MKAITHTLAAALLWVTACGATWWVSNNPDAVEDFCRDTVLPFIHWDWQPSTEAVGEDLKVSYDRP